MTATGSRLRAMTATLKFRLALASVVLITACVALATQLVLVRVQGGVERALMDLELGNAERMGNLLSSRVVGLQNALRATATDPALLRALARPAELPAFLAERSILATMFGSAFIALPDGRIAALRDADGARDPGVNIADRAYFRQTLAQLRPLVSEPVIGRVANEPVLQFTMPVVDNGRLVAVLCGTLRLSSRNLLDDLTQGGQVVDDPVTTLVIDTAGRVLAHPRSARVMMAADSEPGAAAALARWVQQGRPVERTGDVVNSDGHVVALAGVPAADWVVLRVSRTDTLLGGMVEARRASLQLAAAVAVAGGVFVLALVGWLLRPLSRLQRRVLALGADGLAIDEGWPEGGGEIGRLGAVLQRAMHERRRSEAQIAQVLRQMRSVMASAPIGIAITTRQHFELVSREFAALLGWQEADLVGRPAREIFAAEDEYAALGPRVGAAFASGLPFEGELQFRRRDGRVLWGRMQGRPVDVVDADAGTIWLLEDVTSHRAERERLSWAASHDALTRLANRAAFESRLATLLQPGAMALPAALLFIDLDHFKQVNDHAGHAAGDTVLKAVAALLQARVRGSDLVARLGGDEFGVLLQRCDGAAARRIADQICAGAREIGVDAGAVRVAIGASIGLVEIVGDGSTLIELMARADAACYEAKHGGRNGVRLADASAPLRLAAPT